MKKKLLLILLIVFLFVVVGLYFIYPPISIDLVNGSSINIGLNSNYLEPGYKASFMEEDLTPSVEVEGEVDTSTIGKYKVRYKVKKRMRKVIKERIVNVVDDIKPTITLKGPNHVYLIKGHDYNEFGYTANDNYDQELDVKIDSNLDKNTVGNYEIKYKVVDSSNNEVEVIRNIDVVDGSIATYVPVLMYHFFYEDGDRPDGNYVRKDEFDQQLKYLVDNNYYFPTWEEINEYLNGNIALPERSIMLTFDDGAPSFYDIAYPVADKYNVPVTSFIITSWGPPNNEWFPLVSFQSHSHDMHQGGCSGQGHGGLFQCLNHDDALADAKLSKEIANDAIVFCYPFGDVNDREVEILKEAGYEMAFTTEWGYIKPGMDKYRLPRIRISGWSSFEYFKDLVS